GAVSDYAQNTSLEEFGADLKAVATNVETYENLAGGFLGGGVTKIGKLGTINRSLKNISKLSTSKIRFSQSSVNDLGDIVDSMKKNGWQGNPIDVVEMADGGLTSLDNTRLLAAHEAGIDVQAVVHKADELLPDNLVERFTTKKGVPKTWGDAVNLRIQKQNRGYRDTYPNGSQVINGNY
ncbi:hypothetical protein, partial [Ascidiimonas aurantiaca]|uniref:hypothetical protein n=1 Tax=Ascidiimonas aurantiaca TaxID=1685432 RepID=UPI003BB6FF76